MSIAGVVGAVALAASPAHPVLSVSPSHVELTPGSRQVISIDAGSLPGASITARVTGLTLDPRGRPRLVAAGRAPRLLRLSATTLRVVHGRAQLTILALPAVRAAAGDHPAVLLLEAAERRPAGVLVRLRVGLVVSVRVPGTVVHRLALGAHVSVFRKRRLIEVAVANRGNVTERVDGSRLTLAVVERGHTPVVLRPAPREFLPRSRGLVVFAYPRRIRGACVARLELRQTTRPSVRRYRLRL